jgi:hypothetical protein
MKILGSPECSVKCRFLSNIPVINTPQLIGLGIHQKIIKEYNVSKKEEKRGMKEINEANQGSIIFENGSTEVNGQTYSISKIVISNVGLIASVWGSTIAAEQVVNGILNLLEKSLMDTQLPNIKRRITYKTKVKAKLEIDPQAFLNSELIPLITEFKDQLKKPEYSKVDIQVPIMAFVVFTKPDLSSMLTRIPPEKLETEMNEATTITSYVIQVSDYESYANRIFDIEFGVDLDKTIKFLEKLENTIKSK